MRNRMITAGIFLAIVTGCVQKTYKRTVVFLLETNNAKDIHTVGIRGTDKPLSWDYSMQMVPVKKDSIYKATVSFFTGYKFTEVKFMINEQFELKDQPNRRIEFMDKDSIVYRATFNNAK